MLEREFLLKLAADYGTPLFVYDGDMVVERYNDLFRFIPWKKLRIHYALKANYNPALLTLLRDAGAGFRGDTNKVTFIDRTGREELPLLSKREVAERIAEAMEGLFPKK